MGDTNWFADNGYEVLWVAHWTTARADRCRPATGAVNGWTFWQYTSSGCRARDQPAGWTSTASTARTSRRVLIP